MESSMREQSSGFISFVDFDAFFRTLNSLCGPTDRVLAMEQKAWMAAEGQELDNALRSFQAAMDFLVEGIMFRDQDGVIRAFNAAAGRLLGISLQERLGKRGLGAIQLINADGSHLDEQDLTVYKCLQSGEPILGFVFGVVQGDEVRWFETNASPFKPLGLKELMGESLGVISSFWDITEKKCLLDRLASEASHDFLTALPNRRAFDARLERAVRMVVRSHRPVSLCLCDLDHFKAVNDHLGHQAGDRVLQAFADLLKTTLRGSDFPARLGGDEFAILFEGLAAAQAVRVVERIRSGFRYQPAGAPRPVTSTFGMVDWLPGMSRCQFFQAADDALYIAKEKGRDRIQVGTHEDPPTASLGSCL
jgi:diguanylate cyclase (GGDEF)-like protein/PAS domain S-box-containing protein